MIDENEYFENVASYKLLAKHEVGQNFLIDRNVCKNIVSSLEIKEGDRVLEIGSGAGSLSYYLSQYKEEIDLIDIDEGLVTKLQNDFAGIDNIHPQIGNAMRFEMSGYTKIIGNLPYYITSGILERILLDAKDIKRGVFMVQRETYIRLNSSLGNKDYGPLPLLIKYRAKMNKLYSVPRTCFSPAPHIDSLVFSLDFFEDKNDMEKTRKLYSLISALFLHRRKTILNNLTAYIKDSAKAKEVLQKSAILPTKRPEELTLDDYLRLLENI